MTATMTTISGNHSRFGHPSTQRLPETHSRVVSSSNLFSNSGQKSAQGNSKPILFGSILTTTLTTLLVSTPVEWWLFRGKYLVGGKKTAGMVYEILNMNTTEEKLAYFNEIISDKSRKPLIRMFAAEALVNLEDIPPADKIGILNNFTKDEKIGKRVSKLIMVLDRQRVAQ